MPQHLPMHDDGFPNDNHTAQQQYATYDCPTEERLYGKPIKYHRTHSLDNPFDIHETLP